MTDITEIKISPVGYVVSPYRVKKNTPKDPKDSGIIAEIHILPEYTDCIKGLAKEDTILVVSYLHLAKHDTLMVNRHSDRKHVGVFASRSPSRPNPIATSVTMIHKIEGNVLYVKGIDLLNGTPVLDIKIWNDYKNA